MTDQLAQAVLVFGGIAALFTIPAAVDHWIAKHRPAKDDQ